MSTDPILQHLAGSRPARVPDCAELLDRAFPVEVERKFAPLAPVAAALSGAALLAATSALIWIAPTRICEERGSALARRALLVAERLVDRYPSGDLKHE